MDLGNFSISLAVRDLKASRAFYEKLGFEMVDGNEAQNWIILQNGKAVVGLFQGMFEQNIITLTPSDVRPIVAKLKAAGIQPVEEKLEGESGPAHAVIVDPDGNPILLDQHE